MSGLNQALESESLDVYGRHQRNPVTRTNIGLRIFGKAKLFAVFSNCSSNCWVLIRIIRAE